jgi:hypothetical protein
MEEDDIFAIVKTQMDMQRDMAQSLNSLANLVKAQGQQIERLATELKRCAGAVNQMLASSNVVPFTRSPSRDD